MICHCTRMGIGVCPTSVNLVRTYSGVQGTDSCLRRNDGQKVGLRRLTRPRHCVRRYSTNDPTDVANFCALPPKAGSLTPSAPFSRWPPRRLRKLGSELVAMLRSYQPKLDLSDHVCSNTCPGRSRSTTASA